MEHIVRSDGIYIELDRIRALNELKPPTNHKGVQSLFGKINFVQRFILDYALIVKPINKLLKKNKDFEWTPESQRAFANIKSAIVSSLVLESPNFGKHFILYYFSSEDTTMEILTHKY